MEKTKAFEPPHLQPPYAGCDHIDEIALTLSESVFGANGDLSKEDILEDVILNIRNKLDVWDDNRISIRAAAHLLISMHAYMIRCEHELMNEHAQRETALKS